MNHPSTQSSPCDLRPSTQCQSRNEGHSECPEWAWRGNRHQIQEPGRRHIERAHDGPSPLEPQSAEGGGDAGSQVPRILWDYGRGLSGLANTLTPRSTGYAALIRPTQHTKERVAEPI